MPDTDKAAETVKKRSIYRRSELGPGRYVRFEREKDERLTEISDSLGVETAEIVRIAVDELFERKALQVLVRLATKRRTQATQKRTAPPKAPAVPKRAARSAAAIEYVPIEEMVTA